MKPLFFLSFIAIITISACSKEITITEEQLPNEVLYLEGKTVPFTGKCQINYSHTNQVHYLFHYEKGILNGPFQSFYKNGKLEDEGQYVDGELQGKFVKYAEDGKISSTYILKDGEVAKRG